MHKSSIRKEYIFDFKTRGLWALLPGFQHVAPFIQYSEFPLFPQITSLMPMGCAYSGGQTAN